MSSVLLVALPVSYFLFKVGFPPYYIQIVYIITSILITIITLFLLKRLMAFDIRALIKTTYLRIVLVVIFILPLFFITRFFNDALWYFILLSILATMWFLVVVYFVGLEKSEKAVIFRALKSIKDKLR